MKRCSADIQLINSQKKMKRLQKEEFKKKTYLEDSNNVCKFHIVDKHNDTITEAPGTSLKKNNACLVPFRPLFTHQVFSSAEKIHGYTGLKIDVYLTCATLKCYLRVRYNKCSEKRDNIEKLLSKHFGGHFTLDPKEFQEWLKEDLEEFTPIGKKVYEFDRICDKHRHYEVYKVRLNDKKFPSQMNRCLQAMLYFYIESASFIEKDPSWNYFLLYEVVKKFKNNPTSYRLIGYSTTYESNEAKNSTNRISQFLILPPYQKQGFGKSLVEGIYKHYMSSKICKDISVEKPTKAFHMLCESVKADLLGDESNQKSIKIHTEDKDAKCPKSKTSGSTKNTQDEAKIEKKTIKVMRKRVRKERISSDSTSEQNHNHVYKDSIICNSSINSSYSISSDHSDDDSEWKSPHEKCNINSNTKRYNALPQTRSRHKEVAIKGIKLKRSRQDEELECRISLAKSKKMIAKVR